MTRGKKVQDSTLVERTLGPVNMATPEDEVEAMEEAEIRLNNGEAEDFDEEGEDLDETSLAYIRKQAEEQLGENGTAVEISESDLPLRGAMFSIVIHDIGMLADQVFLDRFVCSMANDAQFNRVAAALLIEDITSRGRKNGDQYDPDGTGTPEIPDGMLSTLSDNQMELISNAEDRIDMANAIIADCKRWHDTFGDGRALLRRRDAEVKKQLIDAREKRNRMGMEMSQKARNLIREARMKRRLSLG